MKTPTLKTPTLTMLGFIVLVSVLLAGRSNAATDVGLLNYRPSDLSFSPSNLLSSNFLAGAGITIHKGKNGRLTFSNTLATTAITNLVQGNIIYVATNGSDAGFVMGRPDKPALTLDFAWARITNNCIVQLGQGDFTVFPSNTVTMTGDARLDSRNKTNVTIRGSGWATRLVGTGPGQYMHFRDMEGLVMEDLLIDGNAFGWSSNGINTVQGAIWINGTNNHLTFRRLKFTDIHGHLIVPNGFPGNFHRNISMIDCEGHNYGSTNMAGVGHDGAALAGCSDNLFVSGLKVFGGMRTVEVFSSGVQYTNVLLVNGTVSDIGTEGIFIQAEVSSVVIGGWTLKGGQRLCHAVTSKGVFVTDGAQNVSVSHVNVENIPGPAFMVQSSVLSVSNVNFDVCSAVNCGDPNLGGAGLLVWDLAGGGNVDSVFFRNSKVVRTIAGDGVTLWGGRNVYVENNSFVDIGTDSIRSGVKSWAGSYDLVTNLVVRNNRFQNYAATTQYALDLNATAQAVLFDNNTVAGNMGWINNAAGVQLTVGMSPQIARPALVAGTYTNLQGDTRAIIPNGSVRTNKLAYPYAGHRVTVEDGSSTAAGTNIWVVTTSGVINNGPAQTNIANNGASITLEGDGTNWRILSQVQPAGSGGSSTNFNEIYVGGIVITNGSKRHWVHLGDNTNVVLNWAVTNCVIASPSNNFTVSWINGPTAGMTDQSLFLEVWNTNSSMGYFQTGGLNGQAVVLLSPGTTNHYVARWNGYSYWIEGRQILSTGTNAVYVMQGGPTIINPTINYLPTLVSGTGGALTNFTLIATQPEVYLNGGTNVSLRAVMGTDPARVNYWNLTITNGSGSNRTLEFSAVTNLWRFAGAYGTNAPSVLTNNTTLLVSGRSQGTNNMVGYTYFAWP